MTDKNVRPIWSDEDLDRALAALRVDAAADPDLSDARMELLAPGGLRKRWAGWGGALVAAAAVLALICGGVVAQQVISADRTDPSDGVPSEASERLAAAAAKITKPDPLPAAGQYSYSVNDEFRYGVHQAPGYTPPARLMTTPPPGTYVSPDPGDFATSRTEKILYRTEHWVPARTTDTWRRVYAYRIASYGSVGPVKPYGPPRVETDEARCGSFRSTKPCPPGPMAYGGRITPKYLAALPRDPEKMLTVIRRDARGREDLSLVRFVTMILEQPRIPADVRRAMLGAVALLPHLQVVDNVADQSRRIGTAFGVRDNDNAWELIVDEKTGAYLGHRWVTLVESAAYGKPGVHERSSFREVIVDRMGQRP